MSVLINMNRNVEQNIGLRPPSPFFRRFFEQLSNTDAIANGDS